MFLSLALVVGTLVVSVFVTEWQSTVAPIEGELSVRGINGQRVRLVRESNGVVHVDAETIADAMFGLGFAHAQDRLWQMEWQVRAVCLVARLIIEHTAEAFQRNAVRSVWQRHTGTRQASENPCASARHQ